MLFRKIALVSFVLLVCIVSLIGFRYDGALFPSAERFGPILCETYVFENTDASVIDTTGAWHFVSMEGKWDAGECTSNDTMLPGLTSAITVLADAGGGLTTVTSAGHGLLDDQWVSITGTTNANGIFEVQNAATNTFQITDTWVADDATGTINRSGSAIAAMAGMHEVEFESSFSPASNNDVIDQSIFKNGTVVKPSERRNTSPGIGDYMSSSGAAYVDLAVGDVISFGMKNTSGTGNFVMRYFRGTIEKK